MSKSTVFLAVFSDYFESILIRENNETGNVERDEICFKSRNEFEDYFMKNNKFGIFRLGSSNFYAAPELFTSLSQDGPRFTLKLTSLLRKLVFTLTLESNAKPFDLIERFPKEKKEEAKEAFLLSVLRSKNSE